MIALNDLSPIGFGAHLVSENESSHRDAMTHALGLGCNLIDTSANYLGGRSERLIGAVLAYLPDEAAFVITKSGYDAAERLPLVETGVANGNLIHPDFLADRIALSLGRLQRSHLDGFLLHSPELFLEQHQSAAGCEEFYDHLRTAFEFLEDQVATGTIRYYGISSNTIPLPLDPRVTIDLRRVMKVAAEVSADHHFRLLEFPYNLAETGATTEHHGGESLLAIAKAHGLTTFSNRPLNAKWADGAVRLALYDDDVALPILEQENVPFERFVDALNQRLDAVSGGDALDFPVIKFLSSNWDKIGNPEAVESIFGDLVDPFLRRLYEDQDRPETHAAAYATFYDHALNASKRSRAARTKAFRTELVDAGHLAADDPRSLPVLACESYLVRGIDHVLVGMRQRRYVDDLRSLFSQRRTS